jgi:phage repressor protein C with HTH and peptisase S24 domain
MTEDNLLKFLAHYSDVNPEWLLTGNGSMLRESKSTEEQQTAIGLKSQVTDSESKNTNNTDTIQEFKENLVNLYDVAASAGYGNFDEMISREKIVGQYYIPNFRDINFMIYVTGSSMYPKYSSGDIVACRILRESRFIQWGKVYVVATREQGLLVKRLKQSKTENCVGAIPDNKSYDEFDIPNDEILGIALVVGVIRLE